MRHSTKRSNSKDKCAFHDDVGHKTEDYFTLKDAIEEEVRNGKQKVKGTIHVIVGTNEDWESSNVKRKAHMRLNVLLEVKPIKQKKKKFAPQVVEDVR
ncbi:hypothetical protein J1N35_025370 [Gossypium stocksii]|uniref:Uncharacterized protein n=1 Tax=Gossypium stocksii TaxID=47602 RepID=A0A9D3V6G0_9ROSI|nr:hypothetical protein J1N35_025370 [Gossypium stocksii]